MAQTRMANLRQRAGYSLLHQQGLLPDLFEYAPDGYLISDMTGRILEANHAAAQLFGLSALHLQTLPLSDLVEPEDLPEFQARLAALQSGTPLQTKNCWTPRFLRRSPVTHQIVPFHAAATIAPVRLSPLEAPTVRWTVRDITHRKQAEEERLTRATQQAAHDESEAPKRQNSTLLDTNTGTFITLDSAWRLTYLNASAGAMCRAVGKDPETLLGRVIWDELPTAMGTGFQTDALRAVATSRMTEFEEYSQGLGRWLHVRISPSDCGVVAYSRDITRSKEAEAAVQATYEKERRISGILENLLLRTTTPNDFPHLSVETFYQAAPGEARIGGDFFDVFTLGEGRVALVVGDVPGNGLAAAELTAEVRYALRTILRDREQPAPAIAHLTDFVCEAQRQGELSSDHLVVVTLIIFDPDRGEAVGLSAGGEPPMVLPAKGGMEIAETGGLLLGVHPGVVYSESHFRLSSGDTLAMFTDGLTEARQGDHGALLCYEGLQTLASASLAQETLHGMGLATMEGLMPGPAAYFRTTPVCCWRGENNAAAEVLPTGPVVF